MVQVVKGHQIGTIELMCMLYCLRRPNQPGVGYSAGYLVAPVSVVASVEEVLWQVWDWVLAGQHYHWRLVEVVQWLLGLSG